MYVCDTCMYECYECDVCMCLCARAMYLVNMYQPLKRFLKKNLPWVDIHVVPLGRLAPGFFENLERSTRCLLAHSPHFFLTFRSMAYAQKLVFEGKLTKRGIHKKNSWKSRFVLRFFQTISPFYCSRKFKKLLENENV